jgi:polysaccharide export outer membrane protein
MLILVLLALMVAPTVRAQQEATDFTRTFEVFMQSPGDILQVIMTGMINDALMVQVGPQGDIYVPPSGLLVVEGMTVGEARDYIDEELSQYLINYDLSLQLLRARRIKVYLLGQVRQPGTYIALAGTTALSLIQTAGSLIQNPQSIDFVEPDVTHPYFRALTSGAGRWLEIFRDGERVGRMDLAQVAIRGRAQGDVVLQDGDALYISPNDHPVVVRGGVARPGTYEIRGNDTVFDVLAQAGGYRNMMMLDTVYVERQVAGSDETEMIELDLTDPDFHAREFTFRPGDILRVPEVRDQVYVLGGVWMPQAIDYHEGWNALDYIAAAGGPTAPADDSAIRIVGFPLTDDQRVTAFDFKNLYMDQPVESVPIEPGDLIYVPWENQPFYGVGITNAIATILGQTLGILRIIKDIG